MAKSERIQTVDSHTGGEPTRVIVEGGPDLGGGTLEHRRERFRSRYDAYRSAVVNEPRGSDVVVGAILCEPIDASCCAGVIFFNNAGYLGMCGHGTMGLVVTLAHFGPHRPRDSPHRNSCGRCASYLSRREPRDGAQCAELPVCVRRFDRRS